MPYVNNQGIRIHYEVEGNGPSLVFQHGFSGNLEGFRDFGYSEVLKNDYRLVLIDARGHGLSDKPHEPKSYEIGLSAGDVVAVLNELNISRAHYLGYSMGGRIGFAMAKYAPERLLSLVIGGMHPYARNFGEYEEQQIQMLRSGMEAYVANLEKASPLRPRTKARLLANDHDAMIAVTLARKHEPGLEDVLPTITVPCLLFVGEADGGYLRVKACVAQIPTATFVSFPNLTHLQTFARSDLVLPHVIKFLEKANQAALGANNARTT